MTTFFLTAKSTSSSSHRPYMANIYISYDIFTYILCVLLYYDRLYYDLVKEFVAQDLFFLCSGIFLKKQQIDVSPLLVRVMYVYL